METINCTKVEISNSCECLICDTCGMGTDSDTCQECNTPTRLIEWCDGSCYEFKIEELESYILPEFLAANNAPRFLRIEGRGMGWQRREGYLITPAEFTPLFDGLKFDGGWRLVFNFAGDSLTVTRYSHDEPTGANFKILAAHDLSRCDYCEDYYTVSDAATRCGDCGACGDCCGYYGHQVGA